MRRVMTFHEYLFVLIMVHSVGIDCQANQVSATSEECNAAWGICNVRFFDHSYHRMRINRVHAIACFPLPLHLSVVEDEERLPVGQPRVGVTEVRASFV